MQLHLVLTIEQPMNNDLLLMGHRGADPPSAITSNIVAINSRLVEAVQQCAPHTFGASPPIPPTVHSPPPATLVDGRHLAIEDSREPLAP